MFVLQIMQVLKYPRGTTIFLLKWTENRNEIQGLPLMFTPAKQMDSCMHILDFIHQSSRTPFFARVITCEETNETRRAKRGANLLPLDPQEKRKNIPQDG